MSRHRSLVMTSLNALASFDWSLMMSRHQYLVATSAQVFYSLQMVVPDVATSISYRDINEMNYILQLISSDVASSISCRDITSCLCRLHWLFSRCRDLSFLSRHHSFSFCSIFSCLSCDPCLDLHQIFFSFPDVASSELDCANLKLHQ